MITKLSVLLVALTLARLNNYGLREGHPKPRHFELSWFRESLAKSLLAHSCEGEGHWEATHKRADFEFTHGRPLDGFWEADLGLEMLPAIIAFTIEISVRLATPNADP